MDESNRLEALQREVQAEIGQFRAAERMGRDEVHDRAVEWQHYDGVLVVNPFR